MKEKFENKDVVVWMNDGVITDVWVDNGSTVVPMKVFEGKSLPELYALLEQHKYFCSNCAKKIKKPFFRHFAGIRCKDCAESYKKNNARSCGLCGRPLWDCTC